MTGYGAHAAQHASIDATLVMAIDLAVCSRAEGRAVEQLTLAERAWLWGLELRGFRNGKPPAMVAALAGGALDDWLWALDQLGLADLADPIRAARSSGSAARGASDAAYGDEPATITTLARFARDHVSDFAAPVDGTALATLAPELLASADDLRKKLVMQSARFPELMAYVDMRDFFAKRPG